MGGWIFLKNNNFVKINQAIIVSLTQETTEQ